MKRLILMFAVALLATTNLAMAQSKKEVDERVDRFGELVEQELFDDCTALVDSWLEQSPNNSDMLHLKSVLCAQTDNCDEAMTLINQALANVKRNSYYNRQFLLFSRGMLHAQMGNVESAIEDYNAAENLLAKKGEESLRDKIHWYRSECYWQLEEYKLAEQDLIAILNYSRDRNRIASALNSISQLYFAVQEYDKAMQYAYLLLVNFEDYSDYALYTMAYVNHAVEQYRLSIDSVILLLKYNYTMLSDEELQMFLFSDLAYAREAIRADIADDSEYEFLDVHMLLCDMVNDYDSLLQLLDYCGDRHSEEQMLFWRAKYSSAAGRYDDAVKYLDELIAVEPNDAYLYATRADVYRLSGQYEKAIAESEIVTAMLPDNAYSYYLRGWCYELIGNDELAMQNYNDGVAVDDTDAYIYLMRGEQYLKAGDTERARSDFERVLELDTTPDDTSARQYALWFLGRGDEAQEWMNRIIANYPGEPGVYYDAACLNARMGNLYQAIDSLYMALERGFKSKVHIQNDDDLDPIRDLEAYKQLMSDYFSE